MVGPVKAFLQGLKAAPAPATGASLPDMRMRVLDEFDRAGIGWIWATDAQGKLIYLADKAIEKLGYDAAELIGRQIEDVFEVDSQNAGEGSARSLKFQIKARNKIRDQVVRFTLGRAANDMRQTWWSNRTPREPRVPTAPSCCGLQPGCATHCVCRDRATCPWWFRTFASKTQSHSTSKSLPAPRSPAA